MMKAVALTDLREMDTIDLSDPQIEHPKDVRIRMGTVGVCGSDIHYYTTGRIGSQVVQYPYRVGHEGAGVVVETGPEVTRVKPGDRIAIEPAISCWECDQCKVGRHHTCRNLRFLGCPGQAEGCLSEFLVMPEECCFPIPDSMTLDQAALSEPLAIGVYAVQQSIPMDGAKVGILGMGPIGLSVMLPARAKGASRIYVTDRIDARLDIARQAGADWGGNPDTEDVVAAIEEREPYNLDVVFDCCGQQEALDQAVEMLKPGGKLMIVGIPEVDRISFSIDKLRRKEIAIQNVRRQVDCVQEALDLIATKAIDVDFMVTHRYPFDRTKTAFDLVAGYEDGVVKAMIDFGVE